MSIVPVLVVVFCSCVLTLDAKPLHSAEELHSGDQLMAQLFQSVEGVIHHLVRSRDLSQKPFARSLRTLEHVSKQIQRSSRQKRQSSAFPGLGQGGNNFGAAGNLAGLGAPSSSPGISFIQGLSTLNKVVSTAAGLDRTKCVPRMVCKFMAQRGVFNGSSLFTTRGPSNMTVDLSKPSTFRSVLGVLQLFQIHRLGAYPFLEAGLWGVAHRDQSRCQDQFSECPSTSEAVISELNSTPGGITGAMANLLESFIPDEPAVAANVAEGTSGSLASGIGGLGQLLGLSSLSSQQSQRPFNQQQSQRPFNQQQFSNPSAGGVNSFLQGGGSAGNFNPANFASGGGFNNFNPNGQTSSGGLNNFNAAGFGNGGAFNSPGALNNFNGGSNFNQAGLSNSQFGGFQTAGLNGGFQNFGTAPGFGQNGFGAGRGSKDGYDDIDLKDSSAVKWTS